MALNGPEDIPLREYIKELKLMVLVYNVTDDSLIRSEEINYSDPKHRTWLGRVTYWAVSNGYSVETIAKSDYTA